MCLRRFSPRPIFSARSAWFFKLRRFQTFGWKLLRAISRKRVGIDVVAPLAGAGARASPSTALRTGPSTARFPSSTALRTGPSTARFPSSTRGRTGLATTSIPPLYSKQAAWDCMSSARLLHWNQACLLQAKRKPAPDKCCCLAAHPARGKPPSAAACRGISASVSPKSTIFRSC